MNFFKWEAKKKQIAAKINKRILRNKSSLREVITDLSFSGVENINDKIVPKPHRIPPKIAKPVIRNPKTAIILVHLEAIFKCRCLPSLICNCFSKTDILILNPIKAYRNFYLNKAAKITKTIKSIYSTIDEITKIPINL